MSTLEGTMRRLGVRWVAPDTRLPPTEERLQSLEAELGCELPSTYREFVLNYGGCAARLCCPNSPSLEFSVFYGFYTDGVYDLPGEMQAHRGRIPPNMLPIGQDQYTNLYCISFKGPRTGQIHFWEREGEQEGSFDNVSLVSSDFVSFLKSLRPEQD